MIIRGETAETSNPAGMIPNPYPTENTDDIDPLAVSVRWNSEEMGKIATDIATLSNAERSATNQHRMRIGANSENCNSLSCSFCKTDDEDSSLLWDSVGRGASISLFSASNPSFAGSWEYSGLFDIISCIHCECPHLRLLVEQFELLLLLRSDLVRKDDFFTKLLLV